jgi:hypothetical protein
MKMFSSRNFTSTDHSDEESELWARTVDLPGFDDNVSPNNIITMLLRFIVGEVKPTFSDDPL